MVLIFVFVSDFRKEVKQRIMGNQLVVKDLEEGVTYTFSVAARTVDYGPAIIVNVTTGPQPGGPSPPHHLTVSPSISVITLTWENGFEGDGQILGYYIEGKREGKGQNKVSIRKINLAEKKEGKIYTKKIS